MSAGPSTIIPNASQSVDLPRREASSNMQSASTSRFGPSLEAGPRNPVETTPFPQLPLAPPPTQRNQVSSGPSDIETVAISPTAPQPRIPPSQLSDRTASDEPRNRLLSEDEDAHPEWVEYIHLDGTTYYRHAPSGRLLTPDDVTQPRIRECLARLYSLTMSTLTEHNFLADLPQDFEIVAERIDPEVPAVFYLVSQSLRRVINYAYDCPCGPTGTHPPEQCPNPKLRLEKTPGARFWTHLASYPMHITALPPHSEADFLKALTQGANERILDERKSMFPYTDQQAQRFMQVYRDLKCVPHSHGRHSVLPALAWHISRVMIKIESVRERYRYGTKDARLYRDIAIDKPTWRGERLLDVLLFCLFFNSHRTYRDRLAATRPKGHVYLPDFRELMSGLLVEWSDSNLLATVFLSANAAFLAVPNIAALPQTASLCSMLFSMLSLVIGVHHVWRHRRRADADEHEAGQYLHVNSQGHRSTLTLLACFLALPLAALLWAILSFTIAVAALCFSSGAGADVHMRPLFAGVFGVLLSLAVLTLLVFWDAWRSPPTTEPEEDYARSLDVNSRRKRQPERKGWLRHARRRMGFVRDDAKDGMQVRMKKLGTVVRRAMSSRKATNVTTSDAGSTKDELAITESRTENTADV